MHRIATALICAAAVAVTATAPASADEERRTVYTLEVFDTVEHSNYFDRSPHRKVSLECHPAGGEHPWAEEACDLIAQHGDIASVRATPEHHCTQEFLPVTFRVSGAEDYEKVFPNVCELDNAKGAIVDF
ncbi:SSI family serine proteinase inhibitor [Nocardiopsis kunsanensis]|uniref:Subtilisin inhibitor domain-containing protein n=1 Tax=Nocardiopsis kunsanensis TaxID=141693 RepID=A0A919CN19_9ACTN|nr:SSI family serine proteinase inhibitor [Nocardiopsis kunsanensis]GHD37384.1 hypothetical protein GCM10007147_45370 [Nocardiopsis kunsanensis]